MTSESAIATSTSTSTSAGTMPKRPRRTVRVWFRRSGGRHLFAIAASLFSLYPIIWIISAAFTKGSTLGRARLIPRSVTFENFQEIFTNNVAPVDRWLWNSFYIGLIAASMNVLVAAFAAYAFSRMHFRGRRGLLTSLLVMQIFPQFLGFIAFFVLSQDFGKVWSSIGYNTHAFLILVYIGGAAGFNAFLLKGFLDSVPKSLDEAARIDGAGQLTIFFRIIMPLARPMLAVIFMISFITIFSEIVLASFLLSGADQLTLPVGLRVFLANSYDANWGLLAATAIVGATPIVLVFVLAQKHIIGGLTAGGVKG